MKKHYFFNFRQIGIFAIVIVFIGLAIEFLVGEDSSPVGSFVFLGLSLLALFVVCISPIYWTIDSKQIKIQYFFGFYEVCDWISISNIYECCSTPSSVFIMNYQIVGGSSGKKAFFTKGEINKSRRARELIRKYWRPDFEVCTENEKRALKGKKTNNKKRR